MPRTLHGCFWPFLILSLFWLSAHAINVYGSSGLGMFFWVLVLQIETNFPRTLFGSFWPAIILSLFICFLFIYLFIWLWLSFPAINARTAVKMTLFGVTVKTTCLLIEGPSIKLSCTHTHTHTTPTERGEPDIWEVIFVASVIDVAM